jgi:hypothetical protein
MSNTEINSLFEITKSLENKGLYVQADKTRDIMVRLSQSAPNPNQIKLQETIKLIISKIEALGPFLKAAGFSNFLTTVKSSLPMIMSKAGSYVLPGLAFYDLLSSLNEVISLSSKFNWNTFFSGEDPTGQEIAVQILIVLQNVCFLLANFNPAFYKDAWAFLASAQTLKITIEATKRGGYSAGGMPGGEEQMHQISTFDLYNPDNLSNPDVKYIIDSIVKELGVGLDNPNAKANASKLPKILGGLDFFMPYVRKYDKKNKFKNLNDPTIPENLQLTSGLLGIQSKIKLLRGNTPDQTKPTKTTIQPKGK